MLGKQGAANVFSAPKLNHKKEDLTDSQCCSIALVAAYNRGIPKTQRTIFRGLITAFSRAQNQLELIKDSGNGNGSGSGSGSGSKLSTPTPAAATAGT